ncbi:MAG TPA: hypothetical protein VN643_05010 [Pyrinomonadaceae bacterium]|nr:hypothetical protein [Pyrinomonadaceae bacterium]
MKFCLPRCAIVLACGLLLSASSAFAQQRSEPLTNSAVIKLVRAGFKDKTVIAIIHSRPNKFDLNPDRLIELKRNNVSENVILAMLSQGAVFTSGDDLADDAFFQDGNSNPSRGADGSKDEGASIFGSGGSSKGEVKGRGMSGAHEDQTQTTGSATVRILRPPVENGSAAVRLEKTPTLTNESVVQLVEAGFSEGTIIKRIEKSPVEFDLSPAKLTELRKKRVTESVIAAMTAAMGETPQAPASSREKSREN